MSKDYLKRPDVEGIRSYAGVVIEIRSAGMKGKADRVYLDRVLPSIIPLCDHTLTVEKRLKMAETDRVAMKEINQECYNTLRSLLAGLVEAVEEDVAIHHVNRRLITKTTAEVLAGIKATDKVNTALTAAKQHLEAAKTMLEGEPK